MITMPPSHHGKHPAGAYLLDSISFSISLYRAQNLQSTINITMVASRSTPALSKAPMNGIIFSEFAPLETSHPDTASAERCKNVCANSIEILTFPVVA
jgi:hypothetical protein